MRAARKRLLDMGEAGSSEQHIGSPREQLQAKASVRTVDSDIEIVEQRCASRTVAPTVAQQQPQLRSVELSPRGEPTQTQR